MSTSARVGLIFIFYLIFVFGKYAEAKYKIKLVNLEKCKIAPGREFKGTPPVTYDLSARKVNRQTTLMRVDINITAREGPVFFAARGYQVQQSTSKDLILNLEKVPCTNGLAMQLMKIISLKLDKNCYSIPGNYSSDKIDIDDFGWILTKLMIGQGKYSYEIEVATPKGVVACISAICDIIKVKQ